jgi:dipeptidase E
MTSHLFTLGGGGYYGPHGGPNRMLLEILRTTGKKHPKVCLIPTASGDRPESFAEFASVMNRMRAHPNFLALYNVPTSDLESWVLDFDAVYIGGGNTRNLMALWREWELDRILIKAMKQGVVVAGGSAGANCWFEQSNSDFIPGEFNPLKGFGLLKGSVCPHYSEEKGRAQSYAAMVKDGRLMNGFGISDRAALHFENYELKEALVEWEEAGVYRVERTAGGELVTTKLVARTV